MSMNPEFRFCPQCAASLEWLPHQEDGGYKERLSCASCGFIHWNNPTPVLAAIVEYRGQVLLARNAAWQNRMFALITGFMEAGETAEGGIAREVKEETNLEVSEVNLVGVYDFQRMNQVIVVYHVVADGEVALSPELAEYKLFDLDKLRCWPQGTGKGLADWLKTRGIEPQFMEFARA